MARNRLNYLLHCKKVVDIVNQHYEDGDTVQVKATARSFAGVPVQNAKVRYTVVRRRAWWWLSYNSYWNQGYIGASSSDEEVASGETMTGVTTFLQPSYFRNHIHVLFLLHDGGSVHAGHRGVG